MTNKIDVPRLKPQLWTVEADQTGQRIDNFLVSRLKGVPKSHIYRLLRKGELRVNKKRTKPDYRVVEGDIVRIPPIRMGATDDKAISIPEKTQIYLEAQVIYEDEQFLVINKPSGMAVHGGSGIRSGVIEMLRHIRPEQKFLELVHRLDRDTSGCLLLAKKPGALKQVHALLREGKMEKIYVALVQGYWPKHLHRVDVPLKKFELKSGERMVNVHPEGKEACTEFRVLKRFEDSTLVEAHLLTGRTHQIRVHTLHVEHPIAGDEKYGDKEFNKTMRALGCKRLFLHAQRLSFEIEGRKISVEANLPPDLESCLDKL